MLRDLRIGQFLPNQGGRARERHTRLGLQSFVIWLWHSGDPTMERPYSSQLRFEKRCIVTGAHLSAPVGAAGHGIADCPKEPRSVSTEIDLSSFDYRFRRSGPTRRTVIYLRTYNPTSCARRISKRSGLSAVERRTLAGTISKRHERR